MDMKLKVESERPIDFYQLMEDLKINLPFLLTSVPLPMSSPKRTTLTLSFDAKSSETKEIEMFFNVGKSQSSYLNCPYFSLLKSSNGSFYVVIIFLKK
jgi:hypothetical protein